jgi:hypothetical protein
VISDLYRTHADATAGAILTTAARLRSAADELTDLAAEVDPAGRLAKPNPRPVSTIVAAAMFEVGNLLSGSDLQRIVDTAALADAERAKGAQPEAKPGPGRCPVVPFGNSDHIIYIEEGAPDDAPQRCLLCGGTWHPAEQRWEPGAITQMQRRIRPGRRPTELPKGVPPVAP